MAKHKITPPLTEEVVSRLKAGDEVFITGIIYAARDAAHKKMVDLIKEGKELPFDIKGQIVYYVGPSPAKPGQPIGSAGPTTSERMDAYTPILLEHGLKGMIGKGFRSKEVKESLVKEKGVYFAAIGGAGALLAKTIKGSKIIAYEELGPEAIRELKVEDFPAIVINDIYGRDLYQEGVNKFKKYSNNRRIL